MYDNHIFLNASLPRTLELFVESLLTKSAQITQARNAKTLTPSHMKQCILSESRFDFLKDLVKNIPDATAQEDSENLPEITDFQPESSKSAEKLGYSTNFYTDQGTSKSVIQYGSKSEIPKIDFSIKSLVEKESTTPEIRIDLTNIIQQPTDVPPLIPIAHNNMYQSNTDNLCIDEDYDN